MPLVTIHACPPSDADAITRMLGDVRDAGARALACAPSNIWVLFKPTSPEYYLQGDHSVGEKPKEPPPPIVIVRAQSGRTHAQRDAFAAAVSAAVARGLSVASERVWLHYQELRPEDVWFEGRWAAAPQEG